jgi:hypothetical protein
MNKIIDKLKSGQPSLTVPGCDTCRHLEDKYRGASWWRCGALGGIYADAAWFRVCKGERWEPAPPHVPVLVRFKRWLIG